jgi:hypothetical protein
VPRRAEKHSSMPGCARREILMTEDVRFIRGNDRISQLAQRPDLAGGVAHVRRGRSTSMTSSTATRTPC